MNTTLAYLRGRRAWLVEGFNVWGTTSDVEIRMAGLEMIGSENRLNFWQLPLGGLRQEVNFADLVDCRGNDLPEQVKKPAVVIIPRESRTAFIHSLLGETGFVAAKANQDGEPVVVDLLIFEMGW